jgi:hypothetical protein
MLDARCSMLDARCSMLDARCSMLDARCSMLDKSINHPADLSRGRAGGSSIQYRESSIGRVGGSSIQYRKSSIGRVGGSSIQYRESAGWVGHKTFSQSLRIDQQRTRVEEADPNANTQRCYKDLYQTPPSWLLPREPSFYWQKSPYAIRSVPVPDGKSLCFSPRSVGDGDGNGEG